MMPTRTPFARSLLAAAALAVLSTSAFAQIRVDRSGATDANTRVGSGGRNFVGGRQNPWEISNRIVYGNVTGGKQFRGPTASTDPQAFRGPTASRQFDNFVRGSSAVTTGGVATYNANTTREYYGDSRIVAPPAGFVGVSTNGGYSPPVPRAWANADTRIASVSTGNPNSTNNLDNNVPVVGGATSVYGDGLGSNVGLNGANGGTNGGLSDYTALNSTTVSDFTPGQIKQLAGDGADSRLPGQTPRNGTTNNNSTDAQPQQLNTGGTPLNATPLNNTPGATPSGATPNGITPNGAPTNATPGLTGSTNGVNPGSAVAPGAAYVGSGPLDFSANGANAPEAGTVTRMVTRTDGKPAPDKIGTADAAAAEGNQAKRPGQAAEQSAREFNAQMRASKQAQEAKKDADQPAPKGNGKAGSKATGNPDAAPADKPAPNKVGTFAAGAAGQGLTDMLSKAESQMKDGKYASAIDTYNAAETLAPRSAILKLGRANAELGGAYYVRSATSLRQALTSDKNLLKNQYDLRAFLGDERLQTAQKDLSDLVQNRPTDTGPAVLLAYVYYNTGNERRAEALLDLADKRAGGRDTLVKALKAGWTFGGETK